MNNARLQFGELWLKIEEHLNQGTDWLDRNFLSLQRLERVYSNNNKLHVKNLPQTTNHLKVQYLQIDKWSKKHKDKKPLSRSILVEQKDYGCQLKYEQQIQLKCNLKSPNINLPLICRLLRWLLLLSTLCLITGSPSLRSRPTAEQIIWKTAIFSNQFI